MRSPKEKAALLQQIDLFASMAEADLLHIAAQVEELEVAAGTVIMHKGELGDCLYILVAGLAHAHDGSLVFNPLNPGDLFGEMAVFDAEERSASVTVLEPSVLFCLRQEPLLLLVQRYPTIAVAVIRSLSQRMRKRVRDRIRDYAYIDQVRQLIGAAQAVEQGSYHNDLILQVGQREDELGQLARVFGRMAEQVQEREQQLRQQVAALRIEIDRERKQKQVDEVTNTDYFQQLRARAASLRQSRERPEEPSS
jgi:CRP-like cAMP-binding protein